MSVKIINKIKMLHYNKIDISEEININKTSGFKKCCDVCYHWYFLNKGFKCQTNVCDRCYDLLMITMNLNNITILKI